MFYINLNALMNALVMFADTMYKMCLQTVTKGLTMFGQTVASSLTGTKSVPVKKDPSTPDNRYRPGIVTIIDVMKVKESQVCTITNLYRFMLVTLKLDIAPSGAHLKVYVKT